MPNRRRFRRINTPPSMEGFKPFGVPMRDLESVNLLYEEYEALRLADYEDLTQEEAAKKEAEAAKKAAEKAKNKVK